MERLEVPVSGKSMEGLINEGDLLRVQLFEQPVSVEQCKPGEIVVIKFEEAWVAHRVVPCGGGLGTKGDQSLVWDTETENSVWGRVDSIRNSRGQMRWPFGSSGFQNLSAFLSARVTQSHFRVFRGIVRRLLYTLSYLARLFSLRPNSIYFWDLDFSKIRILAPLHKLENYLYPQLSEEEKRQVPSWKNIRIEESFKNQMMIETLAEWQNDFPPGFQPVLLKGASLLNRVYSQNGDRQMSDLDLLASREEKKFLDSYLESKGFRPMAEDHGPMNKSKSMWIRDLMGSEFVVEIHEKLILEPKLQFSMELCRKPDQRLSTARFGR